MANDSDEAAKRDAFEHWVIAAYREARRSGRVDWDVMRAGVLKNRILNVSDHQFREPDYDQPRFIDVLRLFPELISADVTVNPPTVELLGKYRQQLDNEPSNVASPRSSGKVRSDLWASILDFRTDDVWIWDEVERKAVRVSNAAPDAILMPTASGEVLQTWAKGFWCPCRLSGLRISKGWSSADPNQWG